ncbi:MAG: hypothetical protein E3K37_12725 [Candidatus Kuenenia sp.]|nr:hypothetical protein [Candidatus Kuenenia hertensis]
MDAGLNNNLPEEKKQNPPFFLSIYRFWIITGVIFLVMIIVFFTVNYSLLKQHTTIHNDLGNLSSMLERYALAKTTYNNKWISAKEQEANIYNEEIEKCRSLINRMDNQLEMTFSNNIPEKGVVKIEDEALWKQEYLKRGSLLLTKLEKSNIEFHESALPFYDWAANIPAWEEIIPEQKRFWILDALVNILLKNTGVTKLEKISFKTVPNNIDTRYESLYSTIPLTISLELEAERVQFLLNELLKSGIPFVIENINIESTTKKTSHMNSGKTLGSSFKNQDAFMAMPVINILIDAYVIDFKT